MKKTFIIAIIFLLLLSGAGAYYFGNEKVNHNYQTPAIKTPNSQSLTTTTAATNSQEETERTCNELANIFKEEIKKDLITQEGSLYRDYISLEEKETDPIGVYCDFSESIDVNNDAKKEFFIYPDSSHNSIRGATGNGPIYLFQEVNSEWKIIGNFEGGMSWMDIGPTKTDGYYDITTLWTYGAGSGEEYYYQWQASTSSYKLEKTEQWEPGNG